SIRRASSSCSVLTATRESSQQDPGGAPEAEHAVAVAEEHGAGIALAAVLAERPADDDAGLAHGRRVGDTCVEPSEDADAAVEVRVDRERAGAVECGPDELRPSGLLPGREPDRGDALAADGSPPQAQRVAGLPRRPADEAVWKRMLGIVRRRSGAFRREPEHR